MKRKKDIIHVVVVIDKIFIIDCRTQFTQQAAISAGSIVSRWANVIEDFSLKRFQQNAAVGREGFSKVKQNFLLW